MRLRLAVCLFGALWASRAAAQTAGQTTPEPRAVEHFDTAKQLYGDGFYREALAELRQAAEIDPKAELIHYNMGQVHERLGEIDAALASYRTCLTLAATPAERDELADIIKRLEGVERTQEVGKALKLPVVAPEPDERQRSLRKAVWATAGIALGLATVGGALIGASVATRPSADSGLPPDDYDAQLRQANHLSLAGDATFGAAGAMAVASIAVAIAALAHDRPKTALWLAPALMPCPRGGMTGAAVGARF